MDWVSGQTIGLSTEPSDYRNTIIYSTDLHSA